MTNPSNELIKALKARRQQLKLSCRALSIRLGYSQETVRHWEDEQNNPSFPSFQNWAQGLGLKITLESLPSNPTGDSNE